MKSLAELIVVNPWTLNAPKEPFHFVFGLAKIKPHLADATFQIPTPDRAEQGGVEAAVSEGQVQRAADEDTKDEQESEEPRPTGNARDAQARSATAKGKITITYDVQKMF